MWRPIADLGLPPFSLSTAIHEFGADTIDATRLQSIATAPSLGRETVVAAIQNPVRNQARTLSAIRAGAVLGKEDWPERHHWRTGHRPRPSDRARDGLHVL